MARTASPVFLSRRSHPGFLLLDVLVGSAVFAVIVVSVGWALLSSQSIGIWSADRMRAVSLAEQAIEAARTIRDQDFSLLVPGDHGVRISNQGLWEFFGTESVSADGFTTAVAVVPSAADRVDIIATTMWSFSPDRTGSMVLSTTFTDWRQERYTGNWSHIAVEGVYLDDTTPDFRDVLVRGDYAFVTGSADNGGAGLYVFDITDRKHPKRIASDFTLFGGGWQLAMGGNVLYVLTGDEAGEIATYDISSPASFSAANLLGKFDLPGAALARSIAMYSTALFVGTVENEEDEFYALDASDPSTITILDSIPIEGGVSDISLHDGYAYIASTSDVSELIVVDIFTAWDMRNMGGFNLTDVPDGRAMAVTGTAALLGRSVGDATAEVALFNLAANPMPSSPPSPAYHDIGGTVNGLAVDATGRYAFLATDCVDAEFIVDDILALSRNEDPRRAWYHTESGNGRAAAYDVVHDRVLFITPSTLIIFMPAS